MIARRGAGVPPPLRARALAVLAAAAAVALASWLTIAAPAPSLLSPYSLAVVVPYLLLAEPIPAFALCSALFMPAGLLLILGRIRRPRGGALLFAVLGPLSIGFTIRGIRPGLIHYGSAHTFGILAINTTICLALAVVLLRALRLPTFGRVLVFHGLLWSWIAWIGLPWLRQLF